MHICIGYAYIDIYIYIVHVKPCKSKSMTSELLPNYAAGAAARLLWTVIDKLLCKIKVMEKKATTGKNFSRLQTKHNKNIYII